jgi:hypothetical protein
LRIIIKEYLSQLKESKEFDKILPDLLISMKFTIISTPQIGVRQHGVDLLSEYIDNKKNKLLYLFVIKQGDIGRSEWDTKSQSVRQSLDEIKDVYLEKMINNEHRKLKKKIILCIGGILKNEVEDNWNGYIKRNTVKNKIEYELWDGLRLAEKFEKYLLNENIFLDNFKSRIRKTLALIGEPDYDLSDYYNLLKENLLTVKKNQNSIIKLLFSFRLILNIIYQWGKENQNLKHALYVAERTLLNVWDLINKKQYNKNKKIIKIFGSIFHDFSAIYTNYYLKIVNLCSIKNGLNGFSRYYLLENINLYEQLGIISIIGLNNFYVGKKCNDDNLLNIAKDVKNTLKIFIDNHDSISSPVYDDHIIEIVLSLILLKSFNEIHYIEEWIKNIINRIEYAYRGLGMYFPVYSDKLDDALLLQNIDNEEKEDFMILSTLILILLIFVTVFNMDTLYKYIIEIINRSFKNTNLQIWFPDIYSDNFLYVDNAGYTSGFTFLPKPLPDNINDMKDLLSKCNNKYMANISISEIKEDFYILPLIASRHFRTPILPFYWFQFMNEDI